MRHKILLQTNFPLMASGLAENGRILAKYLDKTGKYDFVYYGTQASINHGDIARLPYKTLGCIDPRESEALRNDWFNYRDLCYGSRNLHKVIEQEKPTIWVGSDDIWAFQPHVYKSNWFKKINSVLHITVDSLPISKMAYEQAKETPYFITWAKFAQKEMQRNGFNVGHIYGASDTTKFKPISKNEKLELRKKFAIPKDAVIFIYLGRNQLRKEFGNMLLAFAEFQKRNPGVPSKLIFHTGMSEHDRRNGWDIPYLMEYAKVKREDVLVTMFCRQCREWELRPYTGEETDCPFCGTKKAQVTCSPQHAVEHDELHLIYGIADAAISPFTSGGLEFHNVNSLLCGLPLAATNYSCGEDFCEQPFVHPIKVHPRFEVQTSFLKAANDVESMTRFMESIARKTEAQRQELGEIGRDWAMKTFSIETIGGQWEKLFDSMPHPDWSSITLKPVLKNPDFAIPDIADDVAWVKELYRGILNINIQDDDKGLHDWLNSLKQGRSRKSIHAYFVQEATRENARLAPQKDISELFDNNGRKKLLVVMKESGGDIFITTAGFKNLKKLYPDSDLYFACDPKYFEILEGNQNIYKTIAFIPEMENELIMLKYVDHYYYPAIATQKFLNYLSHDNISLDVIEK